MHEETKDVDSVDPGDTREFLAELMKKNDRKKEIGDEIGQFRSDFVDETGYNKTALGFMARLHRLSPEKRGDVLRSIDKIRDDMGPVWSQEESAELDFSE